MFYSFRQTNARFILNLSSRTLECHMSLLIYCMTHVHQGHNFPLWSLTYKLTLSSPEHAPAYMMAANAGVRGVIKAIVSFYRVNSDTAFERQRSRIPIVRGNIWATFCGFSNLEQVLPFRAIFEQNIGLEHISSTKKSTISWKTSIHANFLKAYHVINLLNT